MKTKITDTIYYLGVNDRRKHLFENMWPLPHGVAYNSYLINDAKTALIDTIETTVAGNYLDAVAALLENRPLDYLIINHMEPDHSGMIGALCNRYPQMQLVGNSKTKKMVEAFFGLSEKMIEVSDGALLHLGQHTLKFVFTPWVHWPETMMTYETTEQMLFSCDAFGSFGALNGGIFDDEIDFDFFYKEEMLRYYSNIVGKYSNMVQKAFAKLNGVPLRYICPSHGPVWRAEPTKVVSLYDQWSKHQALEGVVIAFASMYGHTEQMADYIAQKIAALGIRHIRVYDVSKTHISYILKDIWKYRGVILGSCAYNSGMHPMMAHLCHELEVITPKDKVYALFGSCAWSGGGVKSLQTFATASGWEELCAPIEVLGAPTLEKLSLCETLAQVMAARIKK